MVDYNFAKACNGCDGRLLCELQAGRLQDIETAAEAMGALVSAGSVVCYYGPKNYETPTKIAKTICRAEVKPPLITNEYLAQAAAEILADSPVFLLGR